MKRDPVLLKLYFETIRLPSDVPLNFGTWCQYHVRPVRCVSALIRVAIDSDGISQSAARSGFIVAIHCAVRSQFNTPSVPLPKATFQLNTRSVPVVAGGGGGGVLTLIWTV